MRCRKNINDALSARTYDYAVDHGFRAIADRLQWAARGFGPGDRDASLEKIQAARKAAWDAYCSSRGAKWIARRRAKEYAAEGGINKGRTADEWAAIAASRKPLALTVVSALLENEI